MGKLFLSDREVIVSPHGEERLAERGVTHAQVKETLQNADSETPNPDFAGGTNYWKRFEERKIRVSTMIDNGMEVVVSVYVYEKED